LETSAADSRAKAAPHGKFSMDDRRDPLKRNRYIRAETHG
jgi:hypothetical protein